MSLNDHVMLCESLYSLKYEQHNMSQYSNVINYRCFFFCKCTEYINTCTLKYMYNKSCLRTASSPAGYILYCNIFIIKPYNIGHTDLDVFVCKSFCHLDIIIQV